MAAPLAAFRLNLTCAVVLWTMTLASSGFARPLPMMAHIGGGQPDAPLQNLAPKTDSPPIGRYETDEGGIFILDRSKSEPLLKFEDSPEIWVLQPAPGPRGDVIYRNDLGEVMLRVTNMGGMTVFTDKRPGGSPAALDGTSPPLRIPPLSPTGLFNRFYQASIRASRVAQHQVGFVTREDAEPATAAYIADAAQVASEALVDMAGAPNGKSRLARIIGVVIAQGGKPNATMQRGVLTVTIVPAQGVFGRPSSRKIERAAGAR
jgi:hypothetical protein